MATTTSSSSSLVSISTVSSASSSMPQRTTSWPSIHITATMTMGQSGLIESFTFQGDPGSTFATLTTPPPTTTSSFVLLSPSSSSSLSRAATTTTTSLPPPPSPSSSSSSSSSSPAAHHHGHSRRALLIAVPTAVGTLVVVACLVLVWRRVHPASFYKVVARWVPRWCFGPKKPASSGDDVPDDLIALRTVRSFRSDSHSTRRTDVGGDPFLDAGELDTYTRHLRQYEEEAARAREKYSFDAPPSTPVSGRNKNKNTCRGSAATTTPNTIRSTRQGLGYGFGVGESSNGNGNASRGSPRPWFKPKTPTSSPLSTKKTKSNNGDATPTATATPTRREALNLFNSSANNISNGSTNNKNGNGIGNSNNQRRMYGPYRKQVVDDTMSLESWEETWFNLGSDPSASDKDKDKDGNENVDVDGDAGPSMTKPVTPPSPFGFVDAFEAKYGSAGDWERRHQRNRNRRREGQKETTATEPADNAATTTTATTPTTRTMTGTGTGTTTDADTMEGNNTGNTINNDISNDSSDGPGPEVEERADTHTTAEGHGGLDATSATASASGPRDGAGDDPTTGPGQSWRKLV